MFVVCTDFIMVMTLLTRMIVTQSFLSLYSVRTIGALAVPIPFLSPWVKHRLEVIGCL